ncbi:condensation domain-containing protein, partial [Wenjunlia tyrosinilytica]|uniref:condensation domain-containing protein n=1 Tax=Wenjunlia tyrosinilytica TaxID=1544741 RepID=UPI0027E59E49
MPTSPAAVTPCRRRCRIAMWLPRRCWAPVGRSMRSSSPVCWVMSTSRLVSSASVCHLAWSLVLSRLTGRSDVVFGTVLFGRMQAGAGAERGLGLFINTLPVRVDVDARGVLEAARDTQRLLAELLRHEHAPLAVAQGCSRVPAGLPLFTSLLNYRHSPESAHPADPTDSGAGFEVLDTYDRTNYPVVVSVDDLGAEDGGFAVTAQVD